MDLEYDVLGIGEPHYYRGDLFGGSIGLGCFWRASFGAPLIKKVCQRG